MKPIIVTDTTSPLFDEDCFRRTCVSKKKYTTPNHAQYAIDECKSRDSSLNLSYYKCPYCKNYHLTSN